MNINDRIRVRDGEDLPGTNPPVPIEGFEGTILELRVPPEGHVFQGDGRPVTDVVLTVRFDETPEHLARLMAIDKYQGRIFFDDTWNVLADQVEVVQ